MCVLIKRVTLLYKYEADGVASSGGARQANHTLAKDGQPPRRPRHRATALDHIRG
jgi:hypothetical protein